MGATSKSVAVRRLPTGAVMATGAALALALAGCSSSTGSSAGASSSAASGGASAGACAPTGVTLIQSGRGLENEYYVAVDAGAKAFAASVGLTDKYKWIASDGDSAKQLSQIKSILATSGKCTVINIDPNDNSVTPAILDAAKAAGAYVVTQWNKPDGTSPVKYGDTWVSHMSVDGGPQGYETAKALFKAMGGKGSIVALQGILDNVPAKQRFEGLKKALAEYPNITLLEDQTAGWDRTKGQNVTQTFLTKYGNKINGIWTANDGMGLGALEAVKAAGKEGQIKISGTDGLQEAIDAVKNAAKTGFVATTQSTAAVQGAYGLAIGYKAATGAITVADLKPEQRAFYLAMKPIVTAENASTITAPDNVTGLTPITDIWSQIASPITG